MSHVRCARGELPIADPGLHRVGGDEGGARGPKQLAMLEHFGLEPASAVLEVGCGLGRLAYELASYLDADGRYTGFDISPEAVAWLNEHYAPRLPGFQFDLADVSNARYRPSATLTPAEAKFPYSDDSFDVVCAFEVFMHVPLAGVRNYLAEIARVLRSGGTAVLTFVVIWDDEGELLHAGRPFEAIGGGVYTRFPDEPGKSMAYDAELIREILRPDFEIVAEICGLMHGPWKPRPPGPVHNCDAIALKRR